jgi:hypothetical protein
LRLILRCRWLGGAGPSHSGALFWVCAAAMREQLGAAQPVAGWGPPPRCRRGHLVACLRAGAYLRLLHGLVALGAPDLLFHLRGSGARKPEVEQGSAGHATASRRGELAAAPWLLLLLLDDGGDPDMLRAEPMPGALQHAGAPEASQCGG